MNDYQIPAEVLDAISDASDSLPHGKQVMILRNIRQIAAAAYRAGQQQALLAAAEWADETDRVIGGGANWEPRSTGKWLRGRANEIARDYAEERTG